MPLHRYEIRVGNGVENWVEPMSHNVQLIHFVQPGGVSFSLFYFASVA